MITIELSSPLPPYEQIRQQIAAQITSGAIPSNARLPTVRRLASDLNVAPGTVARAYRELEQAGAIRTHGRNGTYVRSTPTTAEQALDNALASAATHARTLGLDPTAVHQRLTAALLNNEHTAARSNPSPTGTRHPTTVPA